MFWHKQENRFKEEGPIDQREKLQELRRSKRFIGVRIQGGCKASSKYAGSFFPFHKVPSLPIEGCDVKICGCVYLGVTDRRSGIDRGGMPSMSVNENRRKIRRKDIWKGIDK